MWNDKGYRDPTASRAIGKVMREQKKKRVEPDAGHYKPGGKAKRSWSEVLKEMEKIDKESRKQNESI